MYVTKLNQVREILGMEVRLESAKLQDGVTVVEYEKLEPGMPVFVVSEDGSTKTPAPEGYHTLEDGTVIEVDAQGIIKEISSEEAEIEDEAPISDEAVVEVSGEAAPEPKMDVAMEEAIIEKVTEKVAEKMKAVFEAVEEVAKEVSSIKEEMGAMRTKMEKFAKMPAATAAPKVTNISNEEFGGIDAKIEFIKSLRK
jgi:predicted house-cleaning noncanonical NTP pyrophosphatase (MazG superfamily)